MAAGRGNQESTLGIVLPLDVDKVVFVVRELAEDLFEIDRLRVHVHLAREKSERLGQAADRINVEALDDGRLEGIRRGDQQSARCSADDCKAMASTPLIGRVSPDGDAPSVAVSRGQALFCSP